MSLSKTLDTSWSKTTLSAAILSETFDMSRKKIFLSVKDLCPSETTVTDIESDTEQSIGDQIMDQQIMFNSDIAESIANDSPDSESDSIIKLPTSLKTKTSIRSKKPLSIKCPCGGRYSKYASKKHVNTHKHLYFLEKGTVYKPPIDKARHDRTYRTKLKIERLNMLHVIEELKDENKSLKEYISKLSAKLEDIVDCLK